MIRIIVNNLNVTPSKGPRLRMALHTVCYEFSLCVNNIGMDWFHVHCVVVDVVTEELWG